jgi:hypothetical protein
MYIVAGSKLKVASCHAQKADQPATCNLQPATIASCRRALPLRVISFVGLLIALGASFAQPAKELRPPPPLERAEGEHQARLLVAHLLAQKPDQDSGNRGALKIRNADGTQRGVLARFMVQVTPTNWLSVYEASPTGNSPGEKFTVIHADELPNQYLLGPSYSRAAGSGAAAQKPISGNDLMKPFAGSDFWLVDLGLDFLHWPQQRVVKKQMRKNLFCDVLESTNPHPATGAYSRVVSWIAVNRPEEIVVVHADAYDSNDKLLKEFDPKRVQKINGVWQLEEMEIRNRQAGTRTKIEFNLEH